MANFTPNVNLEKPLGSEHYLIPKFNANMDKIDTKFGELQNLGGIISEAIAKATPVDADTVALSDSAETGALKKLSWLNIKATLKAYFDTLYATIANLNLKAPLANPTFTGTQTLPNIVTNGIKFPATQVPSSDPNTLDDYEEGTFSPTFSADSGLITSVQVVDARYVKIGKLVHIEVAFNITDKGTATGNLYMLIPFISLDNSSLAGRILNTGEGLSIAVGSNALYAYKATGVSCINNYSYIIGGTYMSLV